MANIDKNGKHSDCQHVIVSSGSALDSANVMWCYCLSVCLSVCFFFC